MKPLIELRKEKLKLTHVRDGALWYKTESGFEFPVPFEDTKGATFEPEVEDGKLFTRWIRIERDRLIKKQTEVEFARQLFDAEVASAARTEFLARKMQEEGLLEVG